MILERIKDILRDCDTNLSNMPATLLYNEGWMLRLILDRFASIDLTNISHPLAIPRGSKWYTESLLPSAFLAERQGDPRAESWTHADGVIGHFVIGHGAKSDLTLLKNAKHFVVTEAKMFSKLSPGVTHAKYFNQAARNVACIAEVLGRAGKQAHKLTALGFYVIAPISQIERGTFAEHLTKDSLRAVVQKRVQEYGGSRDKWFSEWFLPVLERLNVNALSWEDLISYLEGRGAGVEGLREFYERCLEFNKPPE